MWIVFALFAHFWFCSFSITHPFFIFNYIWTYFVFWCKRELCLFFGSGYALQCSCYKFYYFRKIFATRQIFLVTFVIAINQCLSAIWFMMSRFACNVTKTIFCDLHKAVENVDINNCFYCLLPFDQFLLFACTYFLKIKFAPVIGSCITVFHDSANRLQLKCFHK